MVIALVLLLAGAAPAQTNEDALALLQEIASASRAAKSWLADGIQVAELTGRGTQIHGESRFQVAWQSPSQMLSQTTTSEAVAGINGSSSSGTLMVCDGTDQWRHYSPSTSFYRSPLTGGSCKPAIGDFSKIAENVGSVTLRGRDRVPFGGAERECELVRVEYAGTARFVRTLCIDPVEKLVLRDRAERGSAADMLSIETTTYSSYQRDTAIPADRFQFQVPTGYFEDAGPQPDLIVEDGVYRMSILVSVPTLITKVEPFYTAEAGVSGVVLVSFQVSSAGQPEKMKVVRGLGHGMDEKAVEAVSQWHFRSGAKGGVLVPVGPLTVAVSFRRP